jgi:hypothetical protein
MAVVAFILQLRRRGRDVEEPEFVLKITHQCLFSEIRDFVLVDIEGDGIQVTREPGALDHFKKNKASFKNKMTLEPGLVFESGNGAFKCNHDTELVDIETNLGVCR